MWVQEPRVRAYLDALPVGGAAGSFLIARQGTVLLQESRGLANRATSTPNTPETLFDIGSIAKVFTALAVFHLESAGRLALDDPLARHLPAVPADKTAITL